MKEAVILSAVRTPVGKFQGSLQSFAAPKLGAIAVCEAVRRAGLEAALVAAGDSAEPTAAQLEITDCIMGCVLQAGLGQNPARQAAIYGGLSNQVGAFSLRKPLRPAMRRSLSPAAWSR
jgi:acetyl-CoA C-acetyltransferase